MSKKVDAVVIGAGHNGLVTAAYLAKRGRKVLVVEKRTAIGGAAATEEIFPGYHLNSGSNDAGLFLNEIVSDLKLNNHGLTFIQPAAIAHALQPEGKGLTLWRDPAKTATELNSISASDATSFAEFARLLTQLSNVLRTMMLRTPPSLPEYKYGELLAWAPVGLKVKQLGKQDMFELLRTLPMPLEEMLDNYFETPLLQGLLGMFGVSGTMQGPYAAGTALMMLYNAVGTSSGSVRNTQLVEGGMGQLSQALWRAAETAGAELISGNGVAHIVIEDDKATGVVLEDGTRINATIIASSASPYHTFFKLIGPQQFETDFNRDIDNIKYKGSTARINLALSGLPDFQGAEESTAHLTGRIIHSPSLRYLERAYDDAKYGRMSDNPALEMMIPTLSDGGLAPAGHHILSIDVRYAPYALRDGAWDASNKQILRDRVIDILKSYAPNIESLIAHEQIISPADYEANYSLPEGSIYHGQMGLDQMLIMRPIGGYARYRTPIDNLFLCGAGTHPGGGVTGAPGYNAAREILAA